MRSGPAADLTAETFAAAHASCKRFRDVGAPAQAWLFTIAPRQLSHFIADLDGDGVAEVLLDGLGNTADLVIVLRSDGCGLEQVVDEAGDGVRLQIGAVGDSCDAIGGCPVRNRCLTGADGVELESTIVRPQDGQLVMTTTRSRLEGSTLVELDRTEQTYDSIIDLPSDAPTVEDSAIIDC